MSPADFHAAGEGLLGYGWRRKISRALGVDYSTVKRWAAGGSPVPQYVVAALEFLAAVPRQSWPARWQTPSTREPG